MHVYHEYTRQADEEAMASGVWAHVLAHGVVVVTPVAEKNPREQTHWVAPASLLLPLGHDVHVADADVVEKVLAAHAVKVQGST
jgi:hypothetical protein